MTMFRIGLLLLFAASLNANAQLKSLEGVSWHYSNKNVSNAWDGGNSSGGGAGIMCPESVSDQPRVQMLDTYEGKIIHGLTYQEMGLPYHLQIKILADKLSFDFSLKMEFEDAYKDIVSRIQFLPRGVSIHVPPDLGEDPVPFPTGCQIIAVGYYNNEGELITSRDAWEMMSESQKAAFLVHELVYKLARFHSDSKDSIDTRRIVAHLASTTMPDEESRHEIFGPIWWSHFFRDKRDLLGPVRVDLFPEESMQDRVMGYGFYRYNPILLLDQKNEIGFELINEEGRQLEVSIECYSYQESKGAEEFVALQEKRVGRRSPMDVSVTIDPSDRACRILKLDAVNNFGPRGVNLTFQVFLNGEPMMRVKQSFHPFAGLAPVYLPIFYQKLTEDPCSAGFEQPSCSPPRVKE